MNGLRNGNGKKYGDYGQLIFEGLYHDNVRWKGNIYDKKGNIIYVLNKKNNIVKEYDDGG